MTSIKGKSEYGFRPASPLSRLYNTVRQVPSSINEHLEVLRTYAASSDSVCELGVGEGISTTALIMGQPKQLFSFDLVEKPGIHVLLDLASFTKRCPNHVEALIGDTYWVFTTPFDTSTLAVPACDLLFIDTWHAAQQLDAELHLNHERVRKWIILHDVESFGEQGEGWQDWEAQGKGKLRGLKIVVSNFIAEQAGRWQIKEWFTHNNGLAILGRPL